MYRVLHPQLGSASLGPSRSSCAKTAASLNPPKPLSNSTVSFCIERRCKFANLAVALEF